VRRLASLAAALALAGLGCEVDLRPTQDAAPCAPSPGFFLSDVWSQYIRRNTCASDGCHDFATGHGYLRFRLPTPIGPEVTAPLDTWPESWRLNYLTAIQLVRCDDPTASRLLTVPEGLADPHPPGDAVDSHDLADQLFRDWIASP
jgi:hypothetical protein